MEARVHNNSPVENIYIVFKSSEDAITPEPSTVPVSPGSTIQKPVSAATMNLFVWTDPSSEPIWTGAVPTKVQKAIIVSPEKREVSYDSVMLPSGFSPIVDPGRLIGPANGPAMWQWLLLFLIILIFMVIIYFFWWKK